MKENKAWGIVSDFYQGRLTVPRIDGRKTRGRIKVTNTLLVALSECVLQLKGEVETLLADHGRE